MLGDGGNEVLRNLPLRYLACISHQHASRGQGDKFRIFARGQAQAGQQLHTFVEGANGFAMFVGFQHKMHGIADCAQRRVGAQTLWQCGIASQIF